MSKKLTSPVTRCFPSPEKARAVIDFLELLIMCVCLFLRVLKSTTEHLIKRDSNTDYMVHVITIPTSKTQIISGCFRHPLHAASLAGTSLGCTHRYTLMLKEAC